MRVLGEKALLEQRGCKAEDYPVRPCFLQLVRQAPSYRFLLSKFARKNA
jgi:hypothetical protein